MSPEEVQGLIRARELRTLRDRLVTLPAVEVGDLLRSVDDEGRVIIFRILPRDFAADVFSELDVELQKSLLSSLGTTQVAKLLNEMAADDRTALFEEFPASAARQLVTLLDKEERIRALSLLGYPEGSVGRLMSPDYISVRSDWTVREVLDHIRLNGRESDSFDTLYVVDDAGMLVDEIVIKQILLASPGEQISSLMNFAFEALQTFDEQEVSVAKFRRYDRTTLPVVDGRGILVGIVTADDILDVQEEEVTEDIQKLGGTEALEYPYIQTPVSTLVRKRAHWLVLLFLGETITASAMGYFEDEIARAVVLTLFVPLIISSGGNSGSQAATLIIRALALGEVALKDWWRVLKRELIAGASLGAILGLVGFLRIALWSIFTNTYGPHWFFVGLSVAVSLIGVVLVGSVVGSMLPFVLKKANLDPATSSAPFVATLVDVTGVMLYFSVAAFLLSGRLL
jgi:magnesium transporter